MSRPLHEIRAAILLAAILLATPLLSACGSDQVKKAQAIPRILPSELDTGRVRIGGGPAARYAVVTNVGSVPLQLKSARIDGDARGAYKLGAIGPDPTGAGELIVNLEHLPAATPGDDLALLVIEFEEASPARVEARLKGATLDRCPENTVGCGDECVDTATDARHYGACDQACPAPVHAAARCTAGRCARAPCEKGFYDIDGPATLGCESTCEGRTCVAAGSSTPVTLDAAPLPEWALRLDALVSAGAAGSSTQTNARYTNISTLGESTPPPPAGVRTLSNSRYRLVGGFNAAHTK
jgi:hypothetical protein